MQLMEMIIHIGHQKKKTISGLWLTLEQIMILDVLKLIGHLMQERCMTFRFQKMGVIGQLYTDSLKVMVMKLQILNYMPMHVM